MTWWDDAGNEIEDAIPFLLITDEREVAEALEASDPDALRCDHCGAMPGVEHESWCRRPAYKRGGVDTVLVDVIERQNATDERLGVVDDKLDRLIELVQTALAPALGVPVDAPVMRVSPPEPEPTEPEPEFEDGIDPAFLMGTMPVHEAGERQPSNRSTYRGPL